VIVDLDYFKAVNDRYGHSVGDQALRSLARCLADISRQEDCVARYGGEEFAMVFPEAGEEGARSALIRIRHAWRNDSPLTTFSSGIAIHEVGAAPADTFRRADVALYQAKNDGRDCDRVFPIRMATASS